MGMKALLTRSLGGFCTRCEQRNQVWDDASVYQVEEFMLAAFLQECLLLEHMTQRRIREMRSASVQVVLSKSRICSEPGTFPANGVGGDAAARFAADLRFLCLQSRVCVFILDLFVRSDVVSKNDRCQNACSSPSIFDGERVSVAKKSHASADGLVTAQQAGDFAANMDGLICHQLCEFVCSY